MALLELLYSSMAATGGFHFVTANLEIFADDFLHHGLVINDKDA